MVIGLYASRLVVARTFLWHVKLQIKEIVIIILKNNIFDLNVGFGDWIIFLITFQFTKSLNDFLSSDLHENSYEVVMGQFILGNETVNVVKTGQFLHDISVDSLK